MNRLISVCACFWTMRRTKRALDEVFAAVNAGDIHRAFYSIDKGRRIFVRGKFMKTGLINLITIWRGLAMKLHKLGADGVGGECLELADLLQSRFEAGDYYVDF